MTGGEDAGDKNIGVLLFESASKRLLPCCESPSMPSEVGGVGSLDAFPLMAGRGFRLDEVVVDRASSAASSSAYVANVRLRDAYVIIGPAMIVGDR